MATMDRVIELFEERIRHDSPTQMKKAGDLWPGLRFNFFYLTHADDTVDIVVRSITERVAEEDGIKIPEFVFKNLEGMIGPKNAVNDAITQVFLTTFKPPAI